MAINIEVWGTLYNNPNSLVTKPISEPINDHLTIYRRDVPDIVAIPNGHVRVNLTNDSFISPRTLRRELPFDQVKQNWWEEQVRTHAKSEYKSISLWWLWQMIDEAHAYLALSPVNGLNIKQVIDDLLPLIKDAPPHQKVHGLNSSLDVIEILRQQPLPQRYQIQTDRTIQI